MAENTGASQSEVNSAAAAADTSSGQAGYGSGMIGGILDAIIGPVMANQQKGWASRASRHARKFAEYMSSTAYQRAVKDLEAAGLNPMLAYVQGGASSPTVGAAATRSFQSSELGRAAERAVSTGRQAGLMRAQIAHANELVRKTKAEADTAGLGTYKVMSDMELQRKHGQLMDAETVRNMKSGELIDAERSWTNTRDRATRLGIPYSEEQEEWVRGTPVGKASRAIKDSIRKAWKWGNTPMFNEGGESGARKLRRFFDSVLGRDETAAEE